MRARNRSSTSVSLRESHSSQWFSLDISTTDIICTVKQECTLYSHWLVSFPFLVTRWFDGCRILDAHALFFALSALIRPFLLIYFRVFHHLIEHRLPLNSLLWLPREVSYHRSFFFILPISTSSYAREKKQRRIDIVIYRVTSLYRSIIYCLLASLGRHNITEVFILLSSYIPVRSWRCFIPPCPGYSSIWLWFVGSPLIPTVPLVKGHQS